MITYVAGFYFFVVAPVYSGYAFYQAKKLDKDRKRRHELFEKFMDEAMK